MKCSRVMSRPVQAYHQKHTKNKKKIIAKTFSFFLKEKLLSENEPQNPKNLKKMLENIFPQMPE